ncbi:tetratricopeptide repeat protein [bacterium]|nr:tetratricopeptide repeat protein [bacterium]
MKNSNLDRHAILIHRFALIGLLVLTALVYLNGLYGDFVWDDIFLIKENPTLFQNDPTIFFKGQFFPSHKWNTSSYYRPIVSFSYWLNYKFFGISPFYFHVINLLLHLLCVFLFYYLLRRHFRLLKFGSAWLATAIFALHPYHVESITFISGRTDLLATLFFLLALIHYFDYRRYNRVLPLYLSLCSFALGLLSKELIIIFVPVILLWEILINEKTKLKDALISISPFIVITVLYLPIRALILGKISGYNAINLTQLDFPVRLFYAPVFLCNYFSMLFFPFKFNAYRREQCLSICGDGIQFNFTVIVSYLIILILVFFFVLFIIKKRKDLAFWLSTIFIGLALVVNIISLSAAPLSERFLYLPSLGFAYIVASIVTKLSDRVKLKKPRSSIYALFVISVLFYYSGLIYARNFDWRNELMFYSSHLKASPKSVMAHTGMAKIYGEMGEHDSVIYHAKAAISTNKKTLPAYLSLANAYIYQQKFAQAESTLLSASLLAPKNAHLYLTLGNMESKRNNYNEARSYYLEALSLNSDYYFAYLNIGKLEHTLGNHQDAIRYLEKAKELNPLDPYIHRLLSMVYSDIGENEKARVAWKKYLELPGVKVGELIGDEDAPGVIPESMRRK